MKVWVVPADDQVNATGPGGYRYVIYPGRIFVVVTQMTQTNHQVTFVVVTKPVGLDTAPVGPGAGRQPPRAKPGAPVRQN